VTAGAILVVGAGFAGAVYARTLAEAGYQVKVIDRRPHIAGNAYDERDENGVRIHRYGPHLFHTSNEEVVDWVRRFGEWVPYEHRVKALLPDGQLAPLPVNRNTIELVFGIRLENPEAVADFLKSVALPFPEPRNAAEHLYGSIGRELTDLFFRPYTRKMWQMDLEEMDASVVKRIPLRFDEEDRYFPDERFQIMPRDGYTALFECILAHDNISVETAVEFEPAMLRDHHASFLSVPIDEHFEYCFGELPYRSIRFEHRAVARDPGLAWAVTNFTDTGIYTRETHWHIIPYHDGTAAQVTATREIPCDYKDNDHERYYPVKTADNRYVAVYQRYRDLAAENPRVVFIGRCGTYQYLDMHQVINQSLAGARRWLATQ
jgi:UDP-galactopyranose mutase